MSTSFGNKDCLVTGYGFVGIHLIDYLWRQGARVTVIEKNLPSTVIPLEGVEVIKADLRYLTDKLEYDYVFHLAGVTNAAYAESNPMETYEANVLATCNLLSKVKIREKFIFTSSAVVYGNSVLNGPLSESSPANPISIYGATKLASEVLIETFGRTSRVPYNIARFFNLYGPHQAIYYIVPQIIVQALRDRLVTLRNDLAERDFLFVEDAVDCVAKLATSAMQGAVVNVGSGESISLRKLAEHVLEAMDEKNVPIKSGIQRDSFSPFNLQADITKARSIGWEPRTSLRDGLKVTIPYYSKALMTQKLFAKKNK